MSKQTKKLTKNQQEYLKELSLLEKRIETARKKGYIFAGNIQKELPKRITKSMIMALHNIRGNNLKLNSYFIHPKTGEALTGAEGISFEKEQSKRRNNKTVESINIYSVKVDNLEYVLSKLEGFTPARSKGMKPGAYEEQVESVSFLLELLEEQIEIFGKEEIGKRLSRVPEEEIKMLVDAILGGSDGTKIFSARLELSEIIMGRELEPNEEIFQKVMDESEKAENWDAV